MATKHNDDEDDYGGYDIEDLTEEDWKQIKVCAQELYDSKQYGNNQLKCAVAGFLIWAEIHLNDNEDLELHLLQ